MATLSQRRRKTSSQSVNLVRLTRLEKTEAKFTEFLQILNRLWDVFKVTCLTLIFIKRNRTLLFIIHDHFSTIIGDLNRSQHQRMSHIDSLRQGFFQKFLQLLTSTDHFTNSSNRCWLKNQLRKTSEIWNENVEWSILIRDCERQ